MNSDEQAIRTVVDNWLRASSASDVNTMLTLLADDMVFIVPGQPPFGKEEFKAAWDGPMKGAKVATNADVEEVLISGDFGCTRTQLAVCITTPNGNTSRAKGYTMTLFRKQSDGRWLFARDANLLTPEE
ncbi:MAG TPA: SgcJ/EcaC family oxidoreductase [Clostridia bacterium]|nr:SgcJ/EcaC family oxidoreductase [Clostridia bacterium]